MKPRWDTGATDLHVEPAPDFGGEWCQDDMDDLVVAPDGELSVGVGAGAVADAGPLPVFHDAPRLLLVLQALDQVGVA